MGNVNDYGYERTPHRAKKDRKRWCGGRKGREHMPEVTLPPNVPGWKKEYCKPAPDWAVRWGWRIFCDHAIICKSCGRVMGQPEVCPSLGEQVRGEASPDSSV